MATVPAQPRRPRRLQRPRWLDPRIIGGILLIVACVVLGSRVISANAETTPVWMATRDLAVGTVLADGDLAPIEVNLGDTAPQYLGIASVPFGRALAAPVRAGEMVPLAAVTGMPAGRIVVVPVPPDKFPPQVAHGSVIDLYLTVDGPGNDVPVTTLLRSGLTVQDVVGPSSGALSGAAGDRYQLSVLVDVADADMLIRALPTGEAVVALVSG